MSDDGTYHTVVDGETVDALAYVRGLFVSTVWEHSENASLRAVRNHPNALAAGDRIFLPARRNTARDARTGRTHVFRRKGVPSLLRIRVLDAGQPWSDTPWTLIVGDDEVADGVTDAEGMVECSLLPTMLSATLIVGMGDNEQQFDFTVGAIEPDDSIGGVQRRLANLGYYGGEITGELDTDTRLSLMALQRYYELPESGEADAATLGKLREVHG